MDTRESKTALFEAIAVMGKAFASPRRLELLDLLAQGPRSVEELARASDQSSANTSQHLQAPARSGDSHPSARGHPRALRARRGRRARALARLRDASAARWRRSSGQRANTWATRSRRSGARS